MILNTFQEVMNGGEEMIQGIGIDIIELDRIQRMIERHPKFIDRILTSNEKKAYEQLEGKRKIEFAAGRFAAKEAFSKAFGTGIGKTLSFLDIEVATDAHGKPYIHKPLKDCVHLSISHSNQFAVAQVIIESSSS
jgi:holo-[acyl-carrier protein] synthase